MGGMCCFGLLVQVGTVVHQRLRLTWTGRPKWCMLVLPVTLLACCATRRILRKLVGGTEFFAIGRQDVEAAVCAAWVCLSGYSPMQGLSLDMLTRALPAAAGAAYNLAVLYALSMTLVVCAGHAHASGRSKHCAVCKQ